MRNTGIKVHLNIFKAIIWKNILEYKRYPVEIVFTFFMPVVWFLPTYLLIISFAPDGKSSGLESWIGTNNFFAFYMTGVISTYFIFTVFWEMGFSLKRLMDIGLLETIWVCPISKVVYIIGESLFSMIRLTYEIAVMLILYKLVFRMNLPPGFFDAIPFFIPFFLLMYGFGIAFAGVVLLIKDAMMMIDTTSFLVQTLTGSQNPVQVFPRIFMVLSMAIPITYFIDIIRVQTLRIEPIISYHIEILVFLATSVTFPVLGIKIFKEVDKKCRRDGTIHTH
ncbi:MAG: ABC transporter permease [Spirochaetes bacterium]|nr:ABC transporter permease [Spirochaetota bacterium]